MAKTQWQSVRVRRGRGGKKVGVEVVNKKTGESRVLLNPHGKYQKYTFELKDQKRYTNDGKVKRNKAGKPMKLTKAQRSYRAGYRSAVIDQTKAFNAGR